MQNCTCHEIWAASFIRDRIFQSRVEAALRRSAKSRAMTFSRMSRSSVVRLSDGCTGEILNKRRRAGTFIRVRLSRGILFHGAPSPSPSAALAGEQKKKPWNISSYRGPSVLHGISLISRSWSRKCRRTSNYEVSIVCSRITRSTKGFTMRINNKKNTRNEHSRAV